ncbi:YihY family inner membrane protein [Psychrobacter sp. YGAH215]|uniref:YihY/virulence factor BrkB family protein n=1 Tax=Psychrobacter sp. YGAH215 TaxID=2596826 RepID=UPI00118614CB|nr:YihY family inner membrane protein [Psychrobacter sp. YGAH215]TSB22529.1 YihY family inner membrane protein [Psychrobacter sp. YGAH215]
MENLLKKIPFLHQRWFQFLRFLTRHFFEDNCQQKAASLTYTTLLSIVPILTVLLMILSSVPALASVRAQIYEVIYSNLLPQSSLQVSKYINNFAEKSSNLTIIGSMVLFFTTIMTLTTIERAFNQIWRVENRSGGMKSILRYWTIVTLGPLILGTAFIVSSTVQSLSFLNRQIAGYGIDWSFWIQIVSIAVTVAGFISMYWFIPKARVPAKNAAIAGVFVAIIFELMKNLFGTVMANFTSYEAIYGAFAALPIFLLWIYLSWNLILLGVEISYTLTIFETKEVYPRHPLLSLLDMLNLIYTHHLKGEAVSEQALRNVLGRKELPKWYTYINYLQDSNLITMTEEEDYVLKKDLSKMTLWDFYRTLPYPLPIKDELDEMSIEDQKPWLSLLVDRFENTEAYAKQQLALPLNMIFAHSEPRKKSEENTANSTKKTRSKLFRKSNEATPNYLSKKDKDRDNVTPDFDPIAYDKDSDVECDENNNEILIPKDIGDNKPSTLDHRIGKRDDIITEADKPIIK